MHSAAVIADVVLTAVLVGLAVFGGHRFGRRLDRIDARLGGGIHSVDDYVRGYMDGVCKRVPAEADTGGLKSI